MIKPQSIRVHAAVSLPVCKPHAGREGSLGESITVDQWVLWMQEKLSTDPTDCTITISHQMPLQKATESNKGVKINRRALER